MGVSSNGGCCSFGEEEEEEVMEVAAELLKGGVEEENGGGGGDEIENAVRVLLKGLEEDVNRDGIKKTPLRVSKAFRHGTRGYGQKVKDVVQDALFPEAGLDSKVGHAGGNGGLVLVRDITLFSYCESCLLPFEVSCHVGYVPSGHQVVGLSKLSRVSDIFAKRLQSPQRLADEISAALCESIKPAGVAVTLFCRHIQLPVPDENEGGKTGEAGLGGWAEVSVHSSRGIFEDKSSSSWTNFSSLMKLSGINLEKHPKRSTVVSRWCPFATNDSPFYDDRYGMNGLSSQISPRRGTNHSAMVAAVTSILRSLGEDPTRNELKDTPYRFCQWLMNFKRSSPEIRLNGFKHFSSRHKNSLILENKGYPSGIEGNKGVCSELDLRFLSQCEHHLLPFYGVVHVGYMMDEPLGTYERSSLQSIVNFHSYHLQVQERLTRQIAESVHCIFSKGVIVVIEADHICMIARGIEKIGCSTVTLAVLGQFAVDDDAKEAFSQAISNRKAS